MEYAKFIGVIQSPTISMVVILQNPSVFQSCLIDAQSQEQ